MSSYNNPVLAMYIFPQTRYTILCLLLLLFSIHHTVSAQGENNVWCFGKGKGIDFNAGTPVHFNTNMFVLEGSASVSDYAGNFLFYTAGFRIWDRNGNAMPNGTSLLGNGPIYNGEPIGSSAGGAAIVKSVTDDNIYYAFSLGANEDGPASLWYSVVDMSLNGGLGDVVATQKNILMDTNLTEMIVVAKGAECGTYWVIVTRRPPNAAPYASEYRCFKVDAAGVHMTPVVSPTNLWTRFTLSYDGNTMVTMKGGTFEIARFDKVTGQVLPPVVINLPSGSNPTNPQFSPDDSRLYLVGYGLGVIQYDFSLFPNVTAFENSRTIISSNTNFLTDYNLGARLGPDGKIYVINGFSQTNYLGVIHNPNALGLACNYVRAGLALPYDIINPNQFTSLGNPVVINPPADTFVNAAITVKGCFDTAIVLTGSLPGKHLWNTGDTSAYITVTESGTYKKLSYQNCNVVIDQFNVDITSFTTDLGSDTGICPGDTIRLQAAVAGSTYLWQDASTQDTYTAQRAGIYYVSVTQNGCTLTDTIHIGGIDPYVQIREPDTAICAGSSMALHADAFPESTFTWNNGSNESSILTDTQTVYTVAANNVCGTFTDSVSILLQDCNCRFYTPNSFSPNGDGLNDIFEIKNYCQLLEEYSFAVYNRYGQRIFNTLNPGSYWDGIYMGKTVDVGTYFYLLTFKTKDGISGKKKGDIVLLR